jgi:hypothetical protein
MDERGSKGREPASPRGEVRPLQGGEETGLKIACGRRNTRNSSARFDSGPNGLGRVEEGRAWERPSRPGCDEGFYIVARDPCGSCDLFDREDLKESGHRRSADKANPLPRVGGRIQA